MTKFITTIATALLGGSVASLMVAFSVTVLSLVTTICGAIGGWIVGIFYADTFHTVREALHIGPVALWQVGAMLGFLSGFVKSTTVSK